MFITQIHHCFDRLSRWWMLLASSRSMWPSLLRFRSAQRHSSGLSGLSGLTLMGIIRTWLITTGDYTYYTTQYIADYNYREYTTL